MFPCSLCLWDDSYNVQQHPGPKIHHDHYLRPNCSVSPYFSDPVANDSTNSFPCNRRKLRREQLLCSCLSPAPWWGKNAQDDITIPWNKKNRPQNTCRRYNETLPYYFIVGIIFKVSVFIITVLPWWLLLPILCHVLIT